MEALRLLLLLLLSSTGYCSPSSPSHPLDPLTFFEISTVRSILSSHPPFSHPNPFPSISSLSLLEPPKSSILSCLHSSPLLPRRAAVIAYSPNLTHILSVDIPSRLILSHSTIPHPSAFPRLTSSDISRASSTALVDPRVIRAIHNRGLDPSHLNCLPLSPGWFGPQEENRRLAKVQCFAQFYNTTANFYMSPVEGLTVLVDVDVGVVVWVRDEGTEIPISNGEGTDYRYIGGATGRRPRRRGVMMERAGGGRRFEVEGGHMVKWGNWEVHVKPDERAGIVVSMARVREGQGEEWRSVLYKGSASELVVSYMDASEGWYFRG